MKKARAKLARDGVPKPFSKRVKDIIFGRKVQKDEQEFETAGELEAIEVDESTAEDLIEGQE